MDKPCKFLLPSPSFDKKSNGGIKSKPHFLTPSGMTLLPREKQPPPMYGHRGATVPARYLKPVAAQESVPEPPVKQYCEPCELELQSMEDYKRHRAQHEKCPVAGCLYKGHPTVMDKHITSLHSSGLFEKFKKLNTPEEIAAWRAERRKRFPTVANVILKQKAQEQRQKRGERLEATRNRFGKVEDRKRAQPNGEDSRNNNDNRINDGKANNKNQRQKNRNKNNRKGKQDRKDNKPTKESTLEKTKSSEQGLNEEEVPWHGLFAFRGTLQMNDYKHVSSKAKAKTENALFGLVGMYGSDDGESEDEIDVEENERESKKIEVTCQPDTEVNCQTIVIEDIETKDVTINEEPHKNSCEVENNEQMELPDDDCKGVTTNSGRATETIENSDIKEGTTKTLGTTIINTNTCEPSFSNNPPCVQAVNGNTSDEAPEETPIQRSIPEYKITQEESKANNTPPSTNTQGSTKKHNAKQQAQENAAKAKQILKRKSGLDYRKLKLRKQNTMLEKLLETDIRHERNVLLQCVRYVCENNFFGVDNKPSVG